MPRKFKPDEIELIRAIVREEIKAILKEPPKEEQLIEPVMLLRKTKDKK